MSTVPKTQTSETFNESITLCFCFKHLSVSNSRLNRFTSYHIQCSFVTETQTDIVTICLQGKHEHPAEKVIATSENVTLNSVDRFDSGTYKCTAKNNRGPEVSAQVSIHVTCKYGLNL